MPANKAYQPRDVDALPGGNVGLVRLCSTPDLLRRGLVQLKFYSWDEVVKEQGYMKPSGTAQLNCEGLMTLAAFALHLAGKPELARQVIRERPLSDYAVWRRR